MAHFLKKDNCFLPDECWLNGYRLAPGSIRCGFESNSVNSVKQLISFRQIGIETDLQDMV